MLAATTLAIAQEPTPDATGSTPENPFSFGKVFTFLLLTLGPFNVVGPFVAMTRERDAAFKRKLAFEATLIAGLALLVAGLLGARILDNWGVSVGALFVTGGTILFIVALRPVLEQYSRREARAVAAAAASEEEPAASALAFSPLAFPTIVTPYGVAVLIMLMTLAPDSQERLQILGLAALVLVLDLLAMLAAERILKAPFVAIALGISGSVMAVLQIALGVQAIVVGLRILGIVGPGRG